MTLWYWNGTRHRLTTLHLQHLLLAGAALLVTRRIWSWAAQKRGDRGASQAGVPSRSLPGLPWRGIDEFDSSTQLSTVIIMQYMSRVFCSAFTSMAPAMLWLYLL